MSSAEAAQLRAVRYRQLGLWTDERIGYLLDWAAETWPQREHILFQGRRLTFSELAQWVTVAAEELVTVGIEALLLAREGASVVVNGQDAHRQLAE